MAAIMVVKLVRGRGKWFDTMGEVDSVIVGDDGEL